MLNFIKKKLTSIYNSCISRLKGLFTRKEVDQATLDELEEILLGSDAGVAVTRHVLNTVQNAACSTVLSGTQLHTLLKSELLSILTAPKNIVPDCPVYLLVGINGSGKTSCAAKLAHKLLSQQKKVLLVAADTFRAAATDQLEYFAKQLDCPIIKGTQSQDPASVIFAGCQTFMAEQFDAMIIDTAGRLQTKTNLMHELEKISRVVQKQIPHSSICTLLTIDAILGQNSFEQARLFKAAAHVDGIILTKMDSSSKGGVVFAIAKELQIPVTFMAFGEKLEDFKQFDASQYVNDLLDS